MDLQCQRVDWASEQQHIAGLRRRIFIDEQGVNEAEEWDGRDADAQTAHFTATVNGAVVACARLLADGQIGRLCVLAEYRRQGVALALLRQVLQYALQHAYQTIFLHAQTDAIGLYRRCNFQPVGDIFVEAGIDHQRMVLNTGERTTLEAIYRDEVIRLHHPSEFIQHLVQIIGIGTRSVHILSKQLPALLYNAEVADALSQLARSSRNSEVKILVQDTKPLAGSNHPLVLLSQRLPSSVSLRGLTETPQKPEQAYAMVDNSYLVFFNDEDAAQGFANYQATVECHHQLEEFERLWQHHSVIDPELSRLHL